MRPLWTLFILAASGPALAGCAVGPNFHRPAAPEVASLTPPASPLPDTLGSQNFIKGGEVQSGWWRSFKSKPLDDLVEEALKHNSDLAAARAALKAAHQTYLSQISLLLPTADASVGSSRNKSSEYLSPPLNAEAFYYSLQSAELNINYTLDVFGGLRRQLEGSKAQEEAQRFQTEGTYVTLVSNVVVAAVQEASLRDQITAQQKIIQTEQDILSIMGSQLTLGQISRSDVLLQEAALAQAQASLPPLQKLLASQQDLLAYLIGRTPGEGGAPQLDLKSLTLPADLPLSLPSKIVENRADIRAAEADLHQASANVGVAIAARLPNLTITASAGGYGSRFSNLLSNGNGFWSYGAGLAQPIFEGGSLYRKQKAAQAALVQAQELYRSAVLTAFQNVADVLQALNVDARALDVAVSAQHSAAASLEIQRAQLSEGQISVIAVLSAEQTLGAAEQALVQAEATRFTDTAALFQALGGGWQTRGASS